MAGKKKATKGKDDEHKPRRSLKRKSKSHFVTKKLEQTPRPIKRIKAPAKKLRAVRDLVREVVGNAAYEKSMITYLQAGKDKKALRFAKRRLGTLKRAVQKRTFLQDTLR